MSFPGLLRDDPEYRTCLAIARGNSTGGLWLIGGSVYRTLAQRLYGNPRPVVDFDFLCDDLNAAQVVPPDWQVRANKHGNPKFWKGQLSIDLIPLRTLHYIRYHNLDPTIENFLAGTALTVQSIAYDTAREEVIGTLGITAVLTKTVGINNAEEAKYFARRKGRPIETLIKEHAEKLGFQPAYT